MHVRGILALGLAVALGLSAAPAARAADPAAVLEARDERGATSLIRAVQSNQIEQVRQLLDQGARVDATDLNGYTALIWAAQEGHVRLVTLLLIHGADVHAREKHDYTALEWATWEGHADVLQALIAQGANPRRVTRWGFSALDMAMHRGQAGLVGLFMASEPVRRPVPTPPTAAPVANWSVVGASIEGRPIRLAAIGAGPRRVLFIGGIHGDEPQGEPLIANLLAEARANPSWLAGARLLAVPIANPDGIARGTRTNARGVDLNRNFPTNWRQVRTGRTYGGPRPFSEPESRTLATVIQAQRPDVIVSFHAYMACNNYDHPDAGPLARAMARSNGYKLLPSIGYETPGSLGQHAAYGLGIPIVTLETGHETGATIWRRVRESLLMAFAPPRE